MKTSLIYFVAKKSNRKDFKKHLSSRKPTSTQPQNFFTKSKKLLQNNRRSDGEIDEKKDQKILENNFFL